MKKILALLIACFLLAACRIPSTASENCHCLPQSITYQLHGKTYTESAGQYLNKTEGYKMYFLSPFGVEGKGPNDVVVRLIKHGNIDMMIQVMNQGLSTSSLKRKAKEKLAAYQTPILNDHSLQEDPFFKDATVYKIKSKKIFAESILFTVHGKTFIAVIHEPLLMDHTSQFYAMLKSLRVL